MAKPTFPLSVHVVESPADAGKLEAFIRAIRPSWTTVVNNMGLAERILQVVPEMNVNLRHQQGLEQGYWRDKGFNTILEDCKRTDPQRRFWHSYWNEINDVAWDAFVVSELRKMHPEERPKLVLGNYSVGCPNPDNIWESAEGLVVLKGASDMRDSLVIGVHDAYFEGYPLLGWQGNRFINKNITLWPTRPVDDVNNWIVGRHKTALNAFRKMFPNSPLPRWVNTEAQFENVPAVEGLLGRKIEGGHVPHINYVRETFNMTIDDALYVFLYWVVMAAYATSPEMECINIFCWGGHGDVNWNRFNIENNTRFQERVISWKCPAELPQLQNAPRWWEGSAPAPVPLPAPVPTPIPPVAPIPPTTMQKRVVSSNTTFNVRAKPSTSSAVLGTVGSLEVVEWTGKEVDGFYEIVYKGKPAYIAKSVARLI